MWHFKLNILTVDDLALPTDAEEPKLKIISEKRKNIRHLSPAQDKGRSQSRDAKSFPRKSISEEESVVEVDTEPDKDSEIVTYRHKDYSGSSGHYLPEASDESTINSVYSEDFEESVVTDAEPSSKTGSYLCSKSRSARQSILSSNDSYTPSSKAGRWRKRAANTQRVTVKEMAVQVNDAGFTYRWPHASIGVQHAAAPFSNPVSIVSHVVSPDLIEALTTYNPMALALNDLLKQQLFLIRSFVDMTQQIYLSTVKSIENESYCYTTLENTKENYAWKRRMVYLHSAVVALLDGPTV
ncbi:hypothetical protein GDO78_006695 [Eleutherodactylus coqui]|uniref:DUF4614 domain-containing protein n=1 Tax=Eleutherodactylus coqui TaxID=57060 RepID=A0A8J6KCC3_ELECQ|nr:hypothetical protein GDO78_006695 [Eleutherodactylus coqui]